LVSEIFDLKVADRQTDPQTSTSTDNKGPLKLSAREPIIICYCYYVSKKLKKYAERRQRGKEEWEETVGKG